VKGALLQRSNYKIAPVLLTAPANSARDRTSVLRDGRVRADGIDLNFLAMPVAETFFRLLRHREFDVAELLQPEGLFAAEALASFRI
jgi:hypothetical protein